MTRPTRHILVALLLASIALLWADAWAQPAPPASAPTAAQPCGVGGTALRVGQGPVTLTDAQATEQRVRIGADGYWWTCEAPAVMPPPREPQPPACSGEGRSNTCPGRSGRISAGPTGQYTPESHMVRLASCGPSGGPRSGRSGITASTAPPA